MTTRDEEEQIVSFFEQKQRNRDLVIYACTSGYPVSFDEVCLLELPRLRQTFGERVGAIGFSGHHLGIAVDSAAVALGAEFIERHFTGPGKEPIMRHRSNRTACASWCVTAKPYGGP